MTNRQVAAAAVTGILLGALACSSGGAGSVTSLPSTDPVASNATQFCSDALTYVEGLVPSLLPLVCQFAVAASQASNCTEDYNVCTAAGGAVLDAGASNAQFASQFLPNCEKTFAQCKATIGELSQCIADYGTALEAASSGLTAQTACSGSGDPLKSFTTPASCQSLPSGCPVGSSVTVSTSGGSGG